MQILGFCMHYQISHSSYGHAFWFILCSFQGLVLYVYVVQYVNQNHKKEEKTLYYIFNYSKFHFLKLKFCIAIIIIHRTNLGLQTRMQKLDTFIRYHYYIYKVLMNSHATWQIYFHGTRLSNPALSGGCWGHCTAPGAEQSVKKYRTRRNSLQMMRWKVWDQSGQESIYD